MYDSYNLRISENEDAIAEAPALDQCGLEFVEYTNDTKKMYYVDYANVSEPKYALKAIASTDEDFKIFGRIFLPKIEQ